MTESVVEEAVLGWPDQLKYVAAGPALTLVRITFAARPGSGVMPIDYGDVKAREEVSRTLAATRDALLPKLLSGEVSVFVDGPLAEVR